MFNNRNIFNFNCFLIYYKSSLLSGIRKWDEDIILKKNFQALIPAFDPRPGHANIKQVSYCLNYYIIN